MYKKIIKILSLIIVFILVFLVNSNSVYAYGWGFSRNENNEVPDVGKYKAEIEGTSSYYVDPSGEKNIYLTFDAGYDNGILGKILDVLKEKNVKSTFFVTGDFLAREKELALRIVEDGHIIGNHTWGHKNITKISNEEIKAEIEKLENAYFELTNKEMIKFFRPPEGEFDKSSLKVVKGLGYTTFFWSIAYKDWDTTKQNGGKYGYEKIVSNLHPGAIILLHTVSKDNLECLPQVIDEITRQGYTIKNLNEMPL